ncbi:MAG: alpha-amylase family protein [Bacteroidales bacterium]
MNDKFIIYQLLLRVFGNTNENCISNGSFFMNGSGKFNSITTDVLSRIKELQVTHIWYTGVLEHATKTDFTAYGIEADHPAVIKGEAGSPYAIKDYYDVAPSLAGNIPNRMTEFEALVERTHSAGLQVLIDFVPNHLARRYHSDAAPVGVEDFGASDHTTSFHPDNNFYYLGDLKLDTNKFAAAGNDTRGSYYEYPARATGNNCFSASPEITDWYETVKLNYGIDYCSGGTQHFYPIPKTWRMMLNVLCFWAAKGVDGFRCDMAEMVPVEFWHWAITELKKEYPAILMIAEVYNPSLYDSYLKTGGFDYLYDKVGLYDHLKTITQQVSAAFSITNNWQALGEMQNSMLNFLENHDEQRIASDFNIGNPFKAIPELIVSLMLNKAPFMLYFGQEFGERGMLQEGFSALDGRTSIFDYCTAPSVARFLHSALTESEQKLHSIYKQLFSIAMGERAIKCGDTYDLEYANFTNSFFHPNTQFAFARRSRKSIKELDAPDELIIIAVDFAQPALQSAIISSPGPQTGTAIILPKHFFDFWNIISGQEYSCINLLSGSTTNILLTADTPLQITFNQFGFCILKFHLS